MLMAHVDMILFVEADTSGGTQPAASATSGQGGKPEDKIKAAGNAPEDKAADPADPSRKGDASRPNTPAGDETSGFNAKWAKASGGGKKNENNGGNKSGQKGKNK